MCAVDRLGLTLSKPVVQTVPSLQQRFASATAGIGETGNAFVSRLDLDGLKGQFIIGLALGVIWSPCVGPTLGAAIVLAGRGEHLAQIALLMGIFGFGAALPVIVLTFVSRAVITKVRGQLMQAGKTGKVVLGSMMLAIALLILTGADKPFEAWLVDVSPAWLTALTTRF